ncbi:MAG: hypothetical protein M0R77_00930 [Gammaproteobacteria bacterium]|nr:hypothetical protein [Acholeplasmataceae bacterium]MCK9529119.1 hypothetical protein [Gammaproteobacteria bacterium]
MENKLDLLTWYKEVLKTADAYTDEKDHIFLIPGENTVPAMVKEGDVEKQLALPSKEVLSNYYSSTIRFHPLAEDFTRGPSVVVENYKNWALGHMTITMVVAFIALLELSASPQLHAKLDPVQSELLKVAKNAKQGTIDVFKKIIGRIEDEDNELQFIRIFLKKSARINDKAHQWGGMVTFPFYEYLKTNPKKIKSVPLSNENRLTFMSIFEYLFPFINEAHKYSYGSNSNLAPKFESILGAIKNVAIEINTLIQELGDQNQGIEEIELGWVDYLGKTDVFLPEVRFIPMQPGNEGKENKLDKGFISLNPNQTQATSTPTQPSTNESMQQSHTQPSVIDPLPQAQSTQPQQPQVAQQVKKAATLADILGANAAPQMVGGMVAGNQTMMVNPATGQVMGTPSMMPAPMQQQMQQHQMNYIQTLNTPQGPMVLFNNAYIPLQQYQMMLQSNTGMQQPGMMGARYDVLSPIGRPSAANSGGMINGYTVRI